MDFRLSKLERLSDICIYFVYEGPNSKSSLWPTASFHRLRGWWLYDSYPLAHGFREGRSQEGSGDLSGAVHPAGALAAQLLSALALSPRTAST